MVCGGLAGSCGQGLSADLELQAAEAGEDSEHEAIVVVGEMQAELQEDRRGVLGDRLLSDHHLAGDRGVGPFGHQPEHVPLTRAELARSLSSAADPGRPARRGPAASPAQPPRQWWPVVGITLRSRRPARSSSVAYSLAVRSRLPNSTSISMSWIFAKSGTPGPGTTVSISSTLAWSAIAARQLRRIVIASSSSQSCTMYFSR